MSNHPTPVVVAPNPVDRNLAFGIQPVSVGAPTVVQIFSSEMYPELSQLSNRILAADIDISHRTRPHRRQIISMKCAGYIFALL